MKLDEEQQPILYSSDNYSEPSEIDSSLESRLGFIKKVRFWVILGVYNH